MNQPLFDSVPRTSKRRNQTTTTKQIQVNSRQPDKKLSRPLDWGTLRQPWRLTRSEGAVEVNGYEIKRNADLQGANVVQADLCGIIVTAANPFNELPSGANSAGYTAFGADGEPRARVALLLWEGMAATIFDAFAAMKRVVRVTDAPRETDESRQRANLPELEKHLSALRILLGDESPPLKNWELSTRFHDAEEEQTDRG